MNNAVFEKAKELNQDITVVNDLLNSYERYRWISFNSKENVALMVSEQFNKEFVQWLKQKKLSLEKEFAEL